MGEYSFWGCASCKEQTHWRKSVNAGMLPYGKVRTDPSRHTPVYAMAAVATLPCDLTPNVSAHSPTGCGVEVCLPLPGAALQRWGWTSSLLWLSDQSAKLADYESLTLRAVLHAPLLLFGL